MGDPRYTGANGSKTMSDKRMDVIGQNGNDGDHYEEVKCGGFALDPMHREAPGRYHVSPGAAATLHTSTRQFLTAVESELVKARAKFPGEKNLTGLALAEEFGEVIKALLDESRKDVWSEAVQCAAMACRLATEGDHSVTKWRRDKGLDALPNGEEEGDYRGG